MMTEYSPAMPHGEISKAFDGIYTVQGTNITFYNELKIQHSRNMTIVESNGELTLINTVRLDEQGLIELDKLGKVRHIISLGAFHGRDDDFYLDRYNAELWTVKPLNGYDCHKNLKIHSLDESVKLSFIDGGYFPFDNASPAEGFLFIERNQGIIVTCDSIKNWVETDQYFSKETAEMNQANGEISKARISPVWLNATGTQKEDFECLLKLNFKHLISAHGELLKDSAKEDISASVEQIIQSPSLGR